MRSGAVGKLLLEAVRSLDYYPIRNIEGTWYHVHT